MKKPVIDPKPEPVLTCSSLFSEFWSGPDADADHDHDHERKTFESLIGSIISEIDHRQYFTNPFDVKVPLFMEGVM